MLAREHVGAKIAKLLKSSFQPGEVMNCKSWPNMTILILGIDIRASTKEFVV